MTFLMQPSSSAESLPAPGGLQEIFAAIGALRCVRNHPRRVLDVQKHRPPEIAKGLPPLASPDPTIVSADRLRAARLDAGLSQRELALYLSISHNKNSLAEHGLARRLWIEALRFGDFQYWQVKPPGVSRLHNRD